MRPTIPVNAERLYHVSFTDSWLSRFDEIRANHKTVVVTSAEVAKICDLLQVESNLYLVPDGEGAKDVQTLQRAWEFLESIGLERGDLLIAIGGGSVTDFGGFLAATWLRGIEWIAIPTTLAGMVDAAIGGKTGINGSQGKNLIGSFHSPNEVVIDPKLLVTLSERDLCAGLAEVIKCGFIADPEILKILESAPDALFSDAQGRTRLEELIWRSISVKAKIVSEDFRESGSRAFLNYGHTLGHAVERLSHYQLRHGEAVSIGLLFAAYLSHKHLGLEKASYEMHRELLEKFRLPTKFEESSFDSLLSVMRLDKKSLDGIIRFVLLRDIAQPELYSALTEDDLAQAYREVMS